MKKKLVKLGAASLLLAGTTAAVVAKMDKKEEQKKIAKAKREKELKAYRNTECGKQDKNSKGIYYSSGNYEAFARPEKPEGVDDKSAYIVGSGLAALAAACFLVRDGQMKGEKIHILEAMDIAGGACDGIYDPLRGYVMRGGREMENHLLLNPYILHFYDPLIIIYLHHAFHLGFAQLILVVDQKRIPWSAFFLPSIFIPSSSYAFAVTHLPLGVLFRYPCWIKYGS